MPPPSDQELYRPWHDVLRLPAGGGAEVVRAPLTRAAAVLPTDRVRALYACRGFATLDQHASRLAALGLGDRAALRGHLVELVQAGLLVSGSELVRHVREAGGDAARTEAAPRVAAIGLPTRDRVAKLHRALESYLRNGAAHGRELEYVVAEGEVSPATRAATQASLHELAARYRVPIFHAGMPERAAYAAALAKRAGVPLDLAEFALLNPWQIRNDTGAGRNTLLFHAAGEMHVQVDDDTVCRLAPAPGLSPGLTLTSHNDPSETWFPGPGEPILPDSVCEDRSFVALHEELLGRTVSGCAERARQAGLDMASAGAMFFRRLSPGGGRVVMTQMGAAGDTGSGSMWHYLLFSGPTRQRLLASEALYRHAFVNRQAVRASTRAAVTDGTFCLSMVLGLDGRELLPPFLPVLRNTDGIFGVVVRICYPDAFTGFVPWIVEHAPPRARQSTFEAFWASLGNAWMDDLLCLLVSTARAEAEGPDRASCLTAMGQVLMRWGSLPRAELEDMTHLHVLRARSMDLVILEETLAAHRSTPEFWARDVRRTASLVRAALSRPDLGYPADLTGAYGEEEGRAVGQRLVRRFGELLCAWPAMMAAAVELKREEIRPGRLVE